PHLPGQPDRGHELQAHRRHPQRPARAARAAGRVRRVRSPALRPEGLHLGHLQSGAMRPALASAAPRAASARVDRLDGRWVLLPAGLALLLLRPWLPAGPIRWWLLVASYGWLLAVSARTDPLWEPGTGDFRTAAGACGAGAVAL